MTGCAGGAGVADGDALEHAAIVTASTNAEAIRLSTPS
jgi:hypothetical protein